MTALTDHLTAVFEAIVDDYDAQPEGHRERLLHIRSFGHSGFNGWGSDRPAVGQDDLDELLEHNLIDVDYASHGEYLVKPTAYGREVLRQYRRELERASTTTPVDLSWAAVRPVLHAAVDTWSEMGAPLAGFVGGRAVAERLSANADDLAFARAAELLAQGDWLELDYDEDDVVRVRPTMRGVMATRGWPAGDAEVAAERILSVLDELATGGASPAERGWAARARDTLMEVGTKTLAEVVSKSVGGVV
jgi:hypothetical protein